MWSAQRHTRQVFKTLLILKTLGSKTGDFHKPKIIYPNMTKFLPFVLDKNKFLANAKCFILTGTQLEFLTAFLNSSLFKYCFRDSFSDLLGGTRELKKIFFDKIPVIQIDDKTNLEFAHRIEDIQKNYTKNKAVELDKLIFDIYNLTTKEKEEIGFVEIK